MRNYIILNDINSNTINGLLIQQLPPISKPKMRTRVEEIDGRAGDITTQLGFSAYDKTIEIGLYKDFDIDEVISYFNSSGTVVFSNEPDKYYNYEILDQIDFERLIRFRTAKVKMHVQPFKYPTEEEPLVGQYQYVSDTGSNLSLNNTANALFKKFDLKGNTSQDGTPTPSSPIPVNIVSGDNTIKICGKNLAQNIKGFAGTTYTSGNGECFVFYGNTNQTYRWNCSATTNRTVLAYSGDFPTSGISVERLNEWGKGSTFTATKDGWYIFYANNAIDETIKESFIINKGTTQLPYEPYMGNTYPIYLGDIELCKIGTYQDYIYKDNGSWYLHKEIGKVVLDGSEIWSRSGASTSSSFVGALNLPYSGISNKFGTGSSWLCDKFTYGSLGVDYKFNAYNGDATTGYQFFALTIPTTMASDLSSFKTWLETNKPIVYYVLATPTNTLIEDTTLIEQLEAIKNAVSYEGQTNISHDSNDAPFLVDVSALQSGTDELVVDNEGNIYSRPTLDLEGTGIVNVYLEGNQMFQVDLTDTNEIVIDTDEMEAYNPTTQALMNRQVTGNYDNFKLNVGDNTLKFSGDLTKATVTNYVRWL